MLEIESETSSTHQTNHKNQTSNVPFPILPVTISFFLIGIFIVVLSINLSNSSKDLLSVKTKANKFHTLITNSSEILDEDTLVEMLEASEKNIQKLYSLLDSYTDLLERYGQLLAFTGVMIIGIGLVQIVWLFSIKRSKKPSA